MARTEHLDGVRVNVAGDRLKGYPVVASLSVAGDAGQLVYAEIPTLGPATSQSLTLILGPGTYAWQCAKA